MLHTNIESFGALLKYLRRRARLTQRDLAVAVGYTEAHICRLEKNERLPDAATVAALFIPALGIDHELPMVERLLHLAEKAHGRRVPARVEPVISPAPTFYESAVPLDIPPPPRIHIRRKELSAQVVAAVQRDQCVILWGMAGMGKTTLAAAVAAEYRGGPVFWLSVAEGITTNPDAIIRQLALFLRHHGRQQVQVLLEPRAESGTIPFEQQIHLIQATLSPMSALLCFDNAHLLAQHESALQLLNYLSNSNAATLLLTSRTSGLLPGTHIAVSGLAIEEAQSLLRNLDLDLLPQVSERLFVRTACSPMLLRLAAGQLRDLGSDAMALVEHLETQPQLAAYLLNNVLGDLTPGALQLLALLAVFRCPVNLYDPLLAELIERSRQPYHLPEVVSELQRYHLIEQAHAAVLHPLVRDHLFTTLSANATRKKRLHRLAAIWFERSMGDSVEAAYHWLYAGDLEQAAEMLESRSEMLFLYGQAQAAALVAEEALQRAQRRHSDDADLLRRLLNAHGDLLRGSIRTADAEQSYRQALALAQQLPQVRAKLIASMAQLLLQRGQTVESLRLCQSALATLTPHERVLYARLQAVVCRAHLALSQYAEAEHAAQQALAVSAQFAEALPLIADDIRARAERTLGWIYYTRHPTGSTAIEHFYRALAAARRAGLLLHEYAILSNIGTSLVELGDFDAALRALHESLEGYTSIGHMYGKSAALHNLGYLHNVRNEPELALQRLAEASALARQVGDHEGVLSSEGGRASTLISFGKIAEARKILEQILAETIESADIWTIGTCRCLLAEAYLLQGAQGAALAQIEQVLQMEGLLENRRMHAWAISTTALIRIAGGDGRAAYDALAAEPVADLGPEMTLRWRLVQCACALVRGDQAAAHAAAAHVERMAPQPQIRYALPLLERLLQTSSPLEMCHLILVTHGQQ